MVQRKRAKIYESLRSYRGIRFSSESPIVEVSESRKLCGDASSLAEVGPPAELKYLTDLLYKDSRKLHESDR